MALNLNPELVGDSDSLKRNLKAVERHLADDHYIRGFTPGEFSLADAGVTLVTIPAATPRWSALEYADGATSRAVANWRKPTQWRAGKLRVRFWYTSPVGSANNFVVSVRVMAARGTEVLSGTALVAASGTVAGPAVADTLTLSAYTYSTTSLGNDDEIFALQLGREGANASDTNVNVLHVVYVEIEHIPAYTEAQ